MAWIHLYCQRSILECLLPVIVVVARSSRDDFSTISRITQFCIEVIHIMSPGATVRAKPLSTATLKTPSPVFVVIIVVALNSPDVLI